MLKKASSLTLAALLLQLSFAAPVAAKDKEVKAQKHAARIRAAIAKLGVGENARAEVRLGDKTKLVGYISEARDEHFVIIDSRTGKPSSVPYPQVRGVKGNNLSTGAKVAIGLGIAAGVLLFLALLIDE